MKHNLTHGSRKKISDGSNRAFAIFQTLTKTVNDSIRNGEKVEFIPFSKWQKKSGLSISVNLSDFRRNTHN